MKRTCQKALSIFAALAALAAPPAWAEPPAGPGPGADWALCDRHATLAGRRAGLPDHLLGAIAKVESGRWNAERQAILAWPWTVMAEGRGRYLPSREAALAEVRALQARGVRNIDVGCQQINLKHHPQAFESLAQAFDPARNAAYAAGFLRSLRDETRSWTVAIGRYHSRTPHLMGRYRLKVFRAWREARHQARRKEREARRAAAASQGSLLAANAQQGQGLGAVGRPVGPVIRAQTPLVPGLRIGAGVQ